MNKKNILDLLRNKINYIDQKIITLLSQRQSLSIDIINKKINYGLKIRDSIRENILFKKLYTLCLKKNIDYQYITKIFKTIINNSVQIQEEWNQKVKKLDIDKKKINCAVLGPQGSYSNLLFNILLKEKKFFLKEYECLTFESIIKSLHNNTCQFALLPIKNSIAGIIPETYKILQKQKLYIIQEIYVKIKHSLLAVKGTYFSQINNIYSHIQPIQQCSIFIKNFSHWKINYTNSTAKAMQTIFLKNDHHVAVIGNKKGGKLYNLKTLAKNLSNKPNNITRFILLSKKKKKIIPNKSQKTTFFINFINNNFNIKNIINVFREKNLNLENIIKYPDIKNNDQETYYFDVDSVINISILKNYLKIFKKEINKIDTLGSYETVKKVIDIE
ncbi:prephenate dehydratase domain-containing protein [Buchnera aphidicola]|uniref:prephenate dehydratase domain-containing protein n=1 Tax=Buchnera aphidicola TaxID=9 RepID=UPI00094DD623|nr:prephenate dehydratase domain-containing protein [Buchnera aphidicola]